MKSASLGDVVRGGRLGFYFISELGFFVRISGNADSWLIEAKEPGTLPSGASKEPYRVWWEGSQLGRPSAGYKTVARTVKGLLKIKPPPWTINDLGKLQEKLTLPTKEPTNA